MSASRPWHDEDTLREMYHEKEMSQRAIGDELGCSPRTIRSWMDKHEIESRSTKEAVKVCSYNDEQPWQDKETLEELYCEKDMSIVEIANELDGGHNTISKWLHKHGIETRKGHDERHSHYSTSDAGYERWRITDGDSYRAVKIHRLLAVAEHGLEATNGKHVHHKNGVRWDNRAENIELKTPEQHLRDHADDQHDHDNAPWREKAKISQAVDESETQKDAANKLGCSLSTLRYWLNKYEII